MAVMCFGGATILFIFFGITGYAFYGNEIRSTITLNFPKTALFNVIKVNFIQKKKK